MPRFLFYLFGSRIVTNTTRVFKAFSLTSEMFTCIYGYNQGNVYALLRAIMIQLSICLLALFFERSVCLLVSPCAYSYLAHADLQILASISILRLALPLACVVFRFTILSSPISGYARDFPQSLFRSNLMCE